jgi:hypothetical protein
VREERVERGRTHRDITEWIAAARRTCRSWPMRDESTRFRLERGRTRTHRRPHNARHDRGRGDRRGVRSEEGDGPGMVRTRDLRRRQRGPTVVGVAVACRSGAVLQIHDATNSDLE